MSKFVTNWKKKSLFSKILDILFIALLVSMLFPQGRMAIGSFINKMKASVMQPETMSNPVGLKNADFDWDLTSVDNQSVNLQDFKGKVFVLNLFATWCPPFVVEMPGIQKLYNTFKDNDQVVFLLVSNESVETIKKFVEKKNYTFPVYSTRQRNPEAFSTNSIPTTYVISPEGEIVVKEIGALNWGGSKMVQMINDLLP